MMSIVMLSNVMLSAIMLIEMVPEKSNIIMTTRARSYKALCGRNLLIFVKNESVCRWQALPT
jgi:hypothetical protein